MGMDSNKSLKDIIAENMRRFRQEHGYSQEKFAEICGYHRTYIGSIERGERNITLNTVEVLAEALGISVTELLTRKKANNDKEDTSNGSDARK